jgi:hypothetical protein
MGILLAVFGAFSKNGREKPQRQDEKEMRESKSED